MPGTIVVRLTNNRFPDLARRFPREVNRICETSARAIAEDVTQSMGEPKHGRIYGSGPTAHQASAPGESPAIDTGLLAAIHTEAEGDSRWVTYTTAEYAAHLEYGAPAGGLEPRPFFTPAVERERPHFARDLQDLEDRLS